MIWALILAAGESKRMGAPKLLLPFGEKTIIETILDNVLQSQIKNILVVLGANKEKILKKIKNYPVNISFNPNYKQGMLSSVQCGFQNLPRSTQAALVCLGDQPSISCSVINAVTDAYKETKKGIVLPTYKSQRGHPLLIDMKFSRKINRLDPEIGLRGLIHDHSDSIMEVEVNKPGILQDIDDRNDYRKELVKEEIRSK